MKVRLLVTSILTLAGSAICYSQDRGRSEVGIQAGGSFYTGDLTASATGSLKTARPAFGVYYNRYLGNYFSIRANVFAGSLFGDDALNASPAYMPLRKFRFHSPLAEASLLAQFDLFGTNGTIPATRISPYLFGGIGMSFLHVQPDWSRTDSSLIHAGGLTLAGLMRDNLTAKPNFIPVLPVGAGVKYHLTKIIAITAEANYRFTFTDYIDGFSYAANPAKKDGYYSFTMGAVFYLGSSAGYNGNLKDGRGSVGCPRVR
jgi:hypothetical protein